MTDDLQKGETMEREKLEMSGARNNKQKDTRVAFTQSERAHCPETHQEKAWRCQRSQKTKACLPASTAPHP